MRYGIILLAGLVGGYVVASIWQQSDPTPVRVESNTDTPITVPLVNSTSPFAPVTETITVADSHDVMVENVVITDSGNSHITAAPIESVDLGNIDHYLHLAGFFAQLDTADSDQLQHLSQKVLSQFQYNFSNQYYNAISAAVYQRWADVDFEAALESLGDFQTVMHGPNTGIKLNLLQILAKEQPDQMQAWMQSQSRAVRNMVQHTVYAGMAEDDPQAMVRQALELNTPEGEEMLQMALNQWSMKDPEAAWQFMQGTGEAEQHRGAMESILYSWIDLDPATVLPILEQLASESPADKTDHNSYTGLYLRALARTDPHTALDYLSAQTNPDQIGVMDHGAIYELANHHPAVLENWLQQLPDEQLALVGPMAFMPLIETSAMNDPQSAMAMIEKFPQAADMGMQSMILDQWLTTDSDSAFEWLQSRPDTEANRHLIQQSVLMLLHTGENTAATLSRFEQLNLPIDQQTAVQLAYTLGNRDPQQAHDWLSRNTDPATYAIASIAIDANDNSISTEQLLLQLESSSATLQPYVLMDILSSRFQDRDAILQWLETTSMVLESERTELRMMLGGGDEGAAWYTRSGPGVLPSAYGH